MPSKRQEAFEALCVADEAAREASRLFFAAADEAVQTTDPLPAPWQRVSDLYQAMRAKQAERNRAYSAFSSILDLNHTKEQ